MNASPSRTPRPSAALDAETPARLTPREQEIFVSFAHGMSYAQIVEQGNQTGDRPERHLRRPAKVESQDDAGLVLWCVRNGMVGD